MHLDLISVQTNHEGIKCAKPKGQRLTLLIFICTMRDTLGAWAWCTQPDLTLLYIMFTYLWGGSLRSFKIYDSNVALHIFFNHKPAKVTSDFILNYLKKVIGSPTTQKKLKSWQRLCSTQVFTLWDTLYCIIDSRVLQKCKNFHISKSATFSGRLWIFG